MNSPLPFFDSMYGGRIKNSRIGPARSVQTFRADAVASLKSRG